MNKILEVSTYNSTKKSDDNNIITTTFNPPIDISDKENILRFKEGFIDLRNIGNVGSDTIYIEDAINGFIRVAYYEKFNDNNAPEDITKRRDLSDGNIITFNDTGSKWRNRMYVLYKFTYVGTHDDIRSTHDIDKVELFTRNIEFTVPPGTYTSESLIKKINDQLSLSKYAYTQKQIFDGSLQNLYTDNNSYTTWEEIIYNSDLVTFENGLYKSFGAFVDISGSGPMITDPTNANFQAYYYKQDTINNEYAYLFLGSPVFSLSINDNVASFAYTHNPVYDSNGSEIMQLLRIGTDGVFLWRDRRGGCLLVELEPTLLFNDILGFSESNTLKINTGSRYNTINSTGDNSFISSTTHPFIGLSDVDDSSNPGIPSDADRDTTFFGSSQSIFPSLQVNSVLTIDAERSLNFSDLTNGHYLLEIECGLNISNYYDNNTKRNISAIMSKQYLNNGYLSVFAEGSTDISIDSNSSISYITCKILDPDTKTPSKNIGNNNYFYFDLI